MMKIINKQHLRRTCIFIFVFFFFTANCFSSTGKQSDVSGEIQNGFRVLTVPDKGTSLYFTVYRGDYIKLKFHPADVRPLLEIPSLSISQELTADLSNAPYFKMKKVGLYPFTVGSISGEIQVIEYSKLHYQALTADEANTFINRNSPIILDVRTKREYRSGHLENSILIPIQELQQKYTELLKYKNQDVFIYCATGNRSAVASKILIDKGFIHIYNLRNGLFDWAKRGYPIIR